MAELVESEPNDRPEQATALAVPGGLADASDRQVRPAPADVDLYRFESRKGQTWIVEVDAAQRKSPLDAKLEVLDAQGQPVPRLLLQAVRDSYLEFRPIDSIAPGFRARVGKRWSSTNTSICREKCAKSSACHRGRIRKCRCTFPPVSGAVISTLAPCPSAG